MLAAVWLWVAALVVLHRFQVPSWAVRAVRAYVRASVAAASIIGRLVPGVGPLGSVAGAVGGKVGGLFPLRQGRSVRCDPPFPLNRPSLDTLTNISVRYGTAYSTNSEKVGNRW